MKFASTAAALIVYVWSLRLVIRMTLLLFSSFTLAVVTSRAVFRVTDGVASLVPCGGVMSPFMHIKTMICGNGGTTSFWQLVFRTYCTCIFHSSVSVAVTNPGNVRVVYCFQESVSVFWRKSCQSICSSTLLKS